MNNYTGTFTGDAMVLGLYIAGMFSALGIIELGCLAWEKIARKFNGETNE